MCSRPSVLLSSQRMRPCHNQLQRERQICLHQTCSSRVGCNVSEIFSSPKCNPQIFPPYFFNNRDCKYNNVNVSRSYYYLHLALFYSLQHEEILVCRPLRGCMHPLILFRSTSANDETMLSSQVETSILRETGVLSVSLEREQNRSVFSHLSQEAFPGEIMLCMRRMVLFTLFFYSIACFGSVF